MIRKTYKCKLHTFCSSTLSKQNKIDFKKLKQNYYELGVNQKLAVLDLDLGLLAQMGYTLQKTGSLREFW